MQGRDEGVLAMQRSNLTPLIWATSQDGTVFEPFLRIRGALFVNTDYKIDTWCVIARRLYQGSML